LIKGNIFCNWFEISDVRGVEKQEE